MTGRAAHLVAMAVSLLAVAITPARVASAESIGRVVIDHAGRHVAVPDTAMRVVSLDDMDLTVPLFELGVIPIASHGRVDGHGRAFVRSSRMLTGLDFENTGMAFLGINPIDVEAIATLKPDLIVTLKSKGTPLHQLRQIAPVVVVDNIRHGAPAVYALLAEATGTQARARLLETGYREQLGHLLKEAHAQWRSASVITVSRDGRINVEQTYGSLGAVLRDARFQFPAIIDALPMGGSASISPEALPELDADVLFDTYRDDKGEGPQHARARLEALVPNACAFLKACRAGRYIIVPRDEAKSISYRAKALLMDRLLVLIGPALPAR